MNKIFLKFIAAVLLLAIITIACDKQKSHPAEPEMIKVTGGTFTMGCTDDDCFDDGREEPAHKVKLTSYKIAKYPITQKQWEAIMGNYLGSVSSCVGDDFPVCVVGWQDVQIFIEKLNELTGKNYRLPTEAEWEFAARGGNKSKGYKYSGSNDINTVAWYIGNSEDRGHPVGTKMPNELGVYDMSGSVWEWCSDWYGAYTDASQTNPTGPETGTYRVLRGGSFSSYAQLCRVSIRSGLEPYISTGFIGFRLVLP